jgi:hypothetical protein
MWCRERRRLGAGVDHKGAAGGKAAAGEARQQGFIGGHERFDDPGERPPAVFGVIHLGRLRRKVDAPNEAPMIRNIRGIGFVLSANLPSQASPPKGVERPLICGRR